MIGADRRLADTRAAFDAVAASYDGQLGNNALVQRMRARLLAAVVQTVPSGRLLDLGCGTGLDAAWLATRGYRVTAIDASAGMVRRTRERARAAGLDASIDTRHLAIEELDRLGGERYDGAYSDLGALNCVADLAAAARAIGAVLRPGGALVASVIGRICPWEIALFAVKGRWSRATVRWSAAASPVPLGGNVVWTRYYRPSELASAFGAAGFRVTGARALGLLTPPPYMAAFAERHPRLVGALDALEDRIAPWPGVREIGDHFLITMRLDG